MKTCSDLSVISETLTAEELLDANTDYVRGVIYPCDLTKAAFVTPARTFNGYVCDCFSLARRGSGFVLKSPHPFPVRKEYLGEPIAVITAGLPVRP